jgi:adenylate cyclase
MFPEPTVKGATTLEQAAAATGLPEELAGRLTEIVHDLAQRHGGRPVKLLGDGVMFHFPDPPQGVGCALELVDQIPMAGLPRARVGLHSGPVVFQTGHYFGRTVNVAARIGDYARPGEVLVSEEVAAADGSGAVRYDQVGPVSLKGLAAPITIYSAAHAT